MCFFVYVSPHAPTKRVISYTQRGTYGPGVNLGDAMDAAASGSRPYMLSAVMSPMATPAMQPAALGHEFTMRALDDYIDPK